MKPQESGWTIKVSETLAHDGKPRSFSIGRFWNGCAEQWRCYHRGKFFWLMPKTELEADEKIMRYPDQESALREATTLSGIDRIPLWP